MSCFIFQGASPGVLIQSGVRVLSNQKGHIPVGKHFSNLLLSYLVFITSLVKAYHMTKLRGTVGRDFKGMYIGRKVSLGPLLLHYTIISLISKIHFNETNTGPNLKFLVIVKFMFLQNSY